MKNRWFVIDDVLIKNPTKEQIEKGIEAIAIYEGAEDIVIQCWWLDYEHTKCLDFAYSLKELELLNSTFNPKYEQRKLHFKRHGITMTPQHLKSITIPKSMITDDGIQDLGGYRCLKSFLM